MTEQRTDRAIVIEGTTVPTPNSLAVRKLAAKTAVAASKKSGRPVDPRVAKLANS